jgi:CRISPR-associated protein Cas1
MSNFKIISSVTHDMLPRVSDRVPMVYIEHAKINVDDSSIKIWDQHNNKEHSLPIATIMCILCGPGVSITHEAIKSISKTNTCISWVGQDALLYYAHSHSPIDSVKNINKQIKLQTTPKSKLNVIKYLFKDRLSTEMMDGKSLKEMMGYEGIRMRKLYTEMSIKYNIEWTNRKYHNHNWDNVDLVNKLITSFNNALYSISTSAIYALGYLPQVGFIHNKGATPFSYDIADVYKETLSIQSAFEYASKHNSYDRKEVYQFFMKQLNNSNFMVNVVNAVNDSMRIK